MHYTRLVDTPIYTVHQYLNLFYERHVIVLKQIHYHIKIFVALSRNYYVWTVSCDRAITITGEV